MYIDIAICLTKVHLLALCTTARNFLANLNPPFKEVVPKQKGQNTCLNINQYQLSTDLCQSDQRASTTIFSFAFTN